MYRHPLPPLPDGGPRRDSYGWDSQLYNSQQQSRPRRPSTAEAPRPVSQHRAQSRFLEGSMNDRVSAVPPPDFLGGEGDPATAAAWERQFYPRPERAPAARPSTAASNDASAAATAKKGGFLAPLWDGLQQRFGISRSRSSNSIGARGREAVASGTSAAHGGLGAATQQQQPQQHQYHGQAGLAGDRPTREEVLQSYQSLVASGFFDAHAIRSARQPGPGCSAAAGQQQRLQSMLPPGMFNGGQAGDRTSAPPSTSSFAQRMSQQQQQQAQAAQPARFSCPPATSRNPSWSTARPSMDQPPPRPPTYAPPPPPPVASPFRGTKRARTNSDEALDTKAGDNGTSSTALAAAEAGARKLVKKLRKSASRVSVELSLSRPVTGGGGQAVVEDNRGNLIKVPRRSVSIVRSISATFRGDRGATAPPVPAVPNPLPPPAFTHTGSAGANASLSPIEPADSHRVSFETSNRMSLETSRSNGSGGAAHTAATTAAMATAYEQEEPDDALSAADHNTPKKRDIRGRRLRRQRSRCTDSPTKFHNASRPLTGAAGDGSPAPLPIMRPEPGGHDAPPPMPMEGVQRAFPLSTTTTQSAISAAVAAAASRAPTTPPRPAQHPVVPSFHYPQRVRPSPQKPLPQAPLSAAPDLTNRGAAPAPVVPRLSSIASSPGKRVAYAGSENQGGGWWAVR